MEKSLQQQFLDSGGAPVQVGKLTVIQMDRFNIPRKAVIHIDFVGDRAFVDCAAAIAVAKNGRIVLSDGTEATAVLTWDQPDLPRHASYRVDTPDGCLQVYNKYRVRHASGLVTEDSFTGNAGLVVTNVAPNTRRYECSNGPGPFDKSALVFEVRWESAE